MEPIYISVMRIKQKKCILHPYNCYTKATTGKYSSTTSIPVTILSEVLDSFVSLNKLLSRASTVTETLAPSAIKLRGSTSTANG